MSVEEVYASKVLARKPEGKTIFVTNRRWENNTETDFRKTGLNCV
jgi:hypothetical protein